MEAPMAGDSGIESRPMPSKIPAPPPLLCDYIRNSKDYRTTHKSNQRYYNSQDFFCFNDHAKNGSRD
jgi:hypothetical protein